MDHRSRSFARPSGTTTRRLVPAVAAVFGALALASGCAGVVDERAALPSTATVATEPPVAEAPTTTTTVPPSPDEVEVRALLDRFWPPYLAAYEDPTAIDPVLDELVTGDATFTVRGRFEEMARLHQRTVTPDPSVLQHHVMAVTFPEPDRASVRECLVDDLRLVQDITAGSGMPEGAVLVVDDDVATSEITTALVRYDAGWRITLRETTERLEGVRDCGIFSA